jgi:predicted CoA-binding protein
MDQRIEQFLKATAFAVAGASTNREKFGNRVLRCYQQHGRTVYGINPRATEIEGAPCVASVSDLPAEVTSISVVTPPAITEQVVAEAIKKGVKNIWMQPGAESEQAVALCQSHGINVIADGSCILVVLGCRGH